MPNHEVIAKDSAGVKRCYGYGKTGHEALRQCKIACLDYMAGRKDITTLYLFVGDSDKPIIEASNKQQMRVQP